MEERNYWDLFWQTGLPEVWLLGRLEEKPEGAAALGEETNGGAPV